MFIVRRFYYCALIIPVFIVAVFQGCTDNSNLKLVDGGINSPVAERAEQYLPGLEIDDNEFDIFSFDSTPERILELDIDLEEENVSREYHKQNSNADETPQDENVTSSLNSDMPFNQTLSYNEPYSDEQDFYSGQSEYVRISYDLSAGKSGGAGSGAQIYQQSNEQKTIQGTSVNTAAGYGAAESVQDGSSVGGEETAAGQFLENNQQIKSFSQDDKLYFEKDAGEFIDEDASVEIEKFISDSGSIAIDLTDTATETKVDDDQFTAENNYRKPVPTEHISGIDNSGMLAEAQKYDSVVLSMNEAQIINEPALISEKNSNHKNDTGKKKIARLTLVEAIRLSLNGNFDISAASYTSKQVEERLNASKTVYDPTLYQTLSGESKEDLDADYYYQNLNPGMDTSGWSIEGGIRQPLPTGGDVAVAYEYAESKQNGIGKELFKGTGGPVVILNQSLLRGLGDIDNKTAIKISRLNASMAQADFLAQSMDSIYEVCSAYWTLVFYLEQMAIEKRVLAMAKEVYEYEQTRNSSGIARKLNTERASAAVDVRRSALMVMRDNVLAALDQLVLLIGDNNVFADAELVLPTDRPMTSFVSFNQEQAESTALAMRPELMKEYSGVEIGEARKRQAQHNKLPTLDLQARYGLGNGDVGLTDNTQKRRYDKHGYDAGYWKVGLSFGYQIGHRSASAAYREADALISENKVRVEKTKREIRVEVRAAGRALNTAQKNMKITFKARRSALEVLEGERVRFKLGLTTNEELLRSQDYLAEREIDYFRSIIDCNVNALKLARAKGTILSELGIDISGMRKY